MPLPVIFEAISSTHFVTCSCYMPSLADTCSSFFWLKGRCWCWAFFGHMGWTGCYSHCWPSKREEGLITSFISLWLPRVLEHCLVFSSAPSPFYDSAQGNAVSQTSWPLAPPLSEGGLRYLVSTSGRYLPPGRTEGPTKPAKNGWKMHH